MRSLCTSLGCEEFVHEFGSRGVCELRSLYKKFYFDYSQR